MKIAAIRRAVLVARAMLVLTTCAVSLASAEPLLMRPSSPAALRDSPPAFSVAEHRGSFMQGYERVRYVAPGGSLEWGLWMDPTYLSIAQDAIQLVEAQVLGNERCNRYFTERMPNGMTFDDVWNATGEQRVRVSFSAGPSGTWRAATYGDRPYEWTITETAVALGPHSVASAMVHEAARTNGVGSDAAIAYGAERACGLQTFVLTKAIVSRLGWRAGTLHVDRRGRRISPSESPVAQASLPQP